MIVTVDVGGTKTLVSSFDKSGAPGKEYRFPTPQDQSVFIDQLLTLLGSTYEASQISAICIAMPGRVKDNIALWCGNLPWENVDFSKLLGDHYSCPILVENDASLAGLAEANSLGEIPPQCLYITISTGIGTGIITNGKLNTALSGSEAGHMMFYYENKWQEWEDFASGKAIHDHYGKFASEIEDQKTWKEITEKLLLGFLVLIPALGPDVIVIGGSIGTHFSKYQSMLVSQIKQHLPPYMPIPSFAQAQHPEEAVIYGCYYYTVRALKNRNA